jgi:hypothetical protein
MTISQFNTQISLKNYFREIINRIGVCDSVKAKHPSEFLDFCEVFKRHSNYPNKFIGLNDIQIDYSKEFKNQLVVYIKKDDGTRDDVSVLNNCITGKPRDNLKIAMRVSIQPQIDKYKKNNYIKVCELCKGHNHIEIDHHSDKSPFAKLYICFMEINKLPIPIEFDDTKGHMKCFKKIDYNFEKNWIEYHKENAILRMLCRRCNSSQPNYKK